MKPKICIHRPLLALVFGLLALPTFVVRAASQATAPVTKTEAQAFFKHMVELNHNFDPAYADLYASDASVTGHKSDSGEARTITGAEWRQLILFNLPKVKKRDDRSDFNKVRYEALGDKIKVLAERYVRRKCNTDPDYHLVLGRQPDGKILITEEYFELSVPNRCK